VTAAHGPAAVGVPGNGVLGARPRGPVVVCTDRSAAGDRAVRWAAAAARRARTALHVVTAEPPQAGAPAGRRAGFAAALAADRSAGAGALVVPATLPDVEAVVAGSSCPVVVVPDRVPDDERGPVVLAVAPWTGDDAIALAFAEAAGHRAPLLAVRAWSEPGIDLGRPRADRIARWDRCAERARRELAARLAPWRAAHPGVEVRVEAVDDPAAGELLAALSQRARTVVVGRPRPAERVRGAPPLGSRWGSPVAALLRATGCPVLVVPPAQPPQAARRVEGSRS
jgi:hypothetical protein